MGVAFVVLFLIILAIAISWNKLESMYHARDWEPAQCSGLDGAFGLGQTIEANFRRQAKKPSALDDLIITAELRCTEWVRYKSGTDTVTRTEVVRRVPAHVDVIGDDLAAVARVIATVPTDAPATFALRDNKVSWTLQVKLDSPTATDPTHDYPFSVQPRLVAHHG